MNNKFLTNEINTFVTSINIFLTVCDYMQKNLYNMYFEMLVIITELWLYPKPLTLEPT